MVFCHFEVGDAVAEQAGDSVIALEDRNCVAHASELLSGSKDGERVVFAGASEMRKDGMAAGY